MDEKGKINPEIHDDSKLLKELLSYENPKAEHYEKLIAWEENRVTLRGDITSDCHISREWEPLYSNHSERHHAKNEYGFLEKKLQGQTLIDLGSSRYRYIPNIAKLFKAETYIGVDRYYFTDTSPHEPFSADLFKTDLFKNLESKQTDSQSTRIIRIQAYMLAVVSRLQDNSVNYSINGIDEHIIKNPDYHKALQEEVIRTTRKNGIIFGIQSSVLYGLGSSHDSIIKLVPMEELYKVDDGRRVFEKDGLGLPPVKEKSLASRVKDVFSKT